MEVCVYHTGTMFDVHWRGAWAGYAGTLAYPQLGLDAQVVQELLLAPHARGHGLGAALRARLTALGIYRPSGHEHFWGTYTHSASRRSKTKPTTRSYRQEIYGNQYGDFWAL